MAEVSKCTTVTVTEPQITVTISRVVVLRDNAETSTIYKNEALSRYAFRAEGITVSGGTIAALTIKLIVNNVEVISGTVSGVSPGTFNFAYTGDTVSYYKGWTTINDMLNAVGAGNKTSVDICFKFVW